MTSCIPGVQMAHLKYLNKGIKGYHFASLFVSSLRPLYVYGIK